MASNMYGVDIGDVSSAARVVSAPGSSGDGALGGVLEGLAKGLQVFATIDDHRATRKRAEAAAARAAEDQQLQLADRENKREAQGVANDVTQGVNLVNLGSLGDSFSFGKPDAEPEPAPVDPKIAGDVQTAAKTVASTNAAVAQGRMPEISKSSQIDLLFNRLLVKYPGRAHEIAAQFKELGVDSALFDELKNEVDDAAAARKSGREEATKMGNVARENLPADVLSAMTPKDMVQWGLDYTRGQNELDVQTKKASLAGQLQSTDQSKITFDQTQNSQQYFTTVTSMMGSALAPIAKSMQELVLAAGEPGADPAHDARLGSLLGQARTMANVLKQRMIAQGGFTKPEDVNSVNSYVDNYVNSMFIQPYEDRNKGFAQAAQAFQTRTGLTAAVSSPVIHDLQTRFGIRPSDIPGFINSIPPQLLKEVTREFQGAGRPGINQNLATIKLTNALAVIRGDKSLSSIDTPEERQAVIAQSYNYVLGNRAAVARGEGNGDMWMNSTRAMVVASAGFNQQSSSSQLQTVSGALFSADSINAVNKLSVGSGTREEARQLGSGMRASAGQILQATQAKIRGLKHDAVTSPWLVVVDGDGHYNAIENPRWKGSTRYGQGTMRGEPIGVTSRPPVSNEVRQLVATANNTLSFLTATGSWDGDAPKGTPKQVRRLWALGEATPDMRAAKQRAAKTGSFDEMANALERDLDKAPDLIPMSYRNTNTDGQSRGERNNNEGNLEDSPFTRSQPGYKGSDGRFAQFETPEHGRHAQEKLLADKYINKGYNTIYKILGRYAPRSDNAASFDNYAAYVAKRLNVNPNDTLTPAEAGRLAQAMREFETGKRA